MNNYVQVYLASASMADQGIIDLFLDADIIVQSVLLLLVGMSIGCWVIIINRVRFLISAQQQTQSFLDAFWTADSMESIRTQSIGRRL